MDTFKECQGKHIGPGGLKCACCNCFHGTHAAKAKLNRMARAAMKRKLAKELAETKKDSE